jgi:hypothetical protein
LSAGAQAEARRAPRGMAARLSACARLAGLLALCAALSSCLGMAYATTYYRSSGGGDHAATVTEAWVGPQGELALALADLEGVWGREEATLVLTPHELEQAFAAPLTASDKTLPVPHVQLPRAVLTRALAPPPRPPEGSPERVRAAAWEPSAEERSGERALALPGPMDGERFVVSWLHGYRPGIPGETGFALLVARAHAGSVERALFFPEAADVPLWVNALWWTTMAADVALIVLLLA